jgi:hypothetical protein
MFIKGLSVEIEKRQMNVYSWNVKGSEFRGDKGWTHPKV